MEKEASEKQSLGRLICYVTLVVLILFFLFLYAFRLVSINGDTFTRFLIVLIFVLLLLPAVSSIKFFDIIDVRRDVNMFKAELKQRIERLERKK